MATDTTSTRIPLTSADPQAERLTRLRELFPDAFTEGRFDAEKLRAALGEKAVRADERERYGLSWAGKSDALKTLRTLTPATLRPVPGESVAFETTGHAIIEGDNLEVLKVLQHAYYGKVKLIYIDPPYNTGGDFIYPDDYAEGLGSYMAFTRQVREDGAKLTTNVDTSGRFHSRWLTMMFPRLFLARNLLREDGVIFVSIDDHEVHNLRMVMDEIFGEENFIAQLVWEKGRKNDAKLFSVGHEYMLVYARSQIELRENKTIWREEKPGARDIWEQYVKLCAKHGGADAAIETELAAWYAALPKAHPAKKWSRYKRVDANGPWRDRDISWPGGGGPRYDVIHPKTKLPCEVPESGWRFGEEAMQRQIKLGLVEFREDHSKPPFRKAHIRPLVEELENEDGVEGEEADDDEGFATQVRGSYFYKQSQVSVKNLRELLGKKVFNNPKDHEELARLIRYAMGNDTSGIVLDFFGGSGSTAQAVLELNAEDGGNRKFVLVQLPEPTGRTDFPTIAEITKERVRRVIAKMREGMAAKERKEHKESEGELALESGTGVPPVSTAGTAVSPSDLGFRVFKLAESNFAIWDPALAASAPEKLAEQWRLTADNVRADSTEQALLFELILKSGLPLHSPAVPVEVAGDRAWLLDGGTKLICVSRALTRESLRAMVELGPQSVLCLDVAFKGNDALKTNAMLECESHGIKFRTA